LSTPSVTTTSPGSTPAATTVVSASSGSTADSAAPPSVTGTIFTVFPPSTLYTKLAPVELCWMAGVGTSTAWRIVSTSTRAFTNWLGYSALSLLSNCALILIVPVVGSIVLSTASSVPRASRCVRFRSYASTRTGWPVFSRFCSCSSSSSTSVNTTVIGCSWVITARLVVPAACTMFPTSTSRSPIVPSIGEVTWQ